MVNLILVGSHGNKNLKKIVYCACSSFKHLFFNMRCILMQNFKIEKKRAKVLSYILVCYSEYLLSLKQRATTQMRTEPIYSPVLNLYIVFSFFSPQISYSSILFSNKNNLFLKKHLLNMSTLLLGFPGGSVVKNLPANAEEMSSILGSGRYPGGGNGNPLKYACLKNSMDRGAWRATVYGVERSMTQLSD